MSTDYGLFCKDCNDQSFYNGAYDTHWEKILQIWQARKYLANVMRFIRELEGIPIDSLEVKISLDYGNSSPRDIFEFLEKHDGHSIVIVDEYGQFWKEDRSIVE
jgi:hypothetical protein